MKKHQSHSLGLSMAGTLIAIGIIYGDIGTSPLYVMNAIVGKDVISKSLILGALSCIFWTLTLQTTIKYVILTLQADNNGEGGIFSLYALIKRRSKYMLLPAIIGGSTLLADGVITPPISIVSALESLRRYDPEVPTVTISVIIISLLFIIQQFGTKTVGKSFGPVMVIWFIMLAALGFGQIFDKLEVLKAFNPMYGIELLSQYPKGFFLLSGVFLCTTGAEALYSDLGHCGKENIRISWIFVKFSLIINYLGQGAWLLKHEGELLGSRRVFSEMMPEWFVPYGAAIATLAAIVASQALITGSFTLISEAIRLGLWPKMRIVYTTESRGQIFVPTINILLWGGCLFIVYYFKESEKMEGAYGMAITLTMLMTTVLFATYLRLKRRVNIIFVILFLVVFLFIEIAFLMANLHKFEAGGYVTMIIATALVSLMLVWYRARQIRSQLIEFDELEPIKPLLEKLSNDLTLPKYATNLVFMTNSDNLDKIEKKIIYSIFENKPKRADVYWFVHVDVVDKPYTCEYEVHTLASNDLYRVDFKLGFRVEQKVNIFMRKVIEDLINEGELDVDLKYPTKYSFIGGDFRYVVIRKEYSYDNDMKFFDKILVFGHSLIKKMGLSEEKSFGLDQAIVTTETYPLVFNHKVKEFPMHRIKK